MAEEPKEEKSLVQYRSKDGQEIRLSFDIVRKFLISGRAELVTDQEIMLYMGQCKARGLNPFKRDCYLVKYTENDPASTIVSIDYYRARAKAQPDCRGWTAGIIVRYDKDMNPPEFREGAFILEGEELLGGWFRAKPAGWDTERTWTIPLNKYIKKTRDGQPTRFWQKDNQADMISKVAESQGLRRCWPDEFSKLYIKEEINDEMPITEYRPDPMPKRLSEAEPKAEEAKPPKSE